MRSPCAHAANGPVLVSACLAGVPCRFDATARPEPGLLTYVIAGHLIPICPEMLGGLPCPRPPAEIVGGDGHAVLEGRARVVDAEGRDVTEPFISGAHCCLVIARRYGAHAAILKEGSPSCGYHRLHCGGQLLSGCGVTTALLRRHQIQVVPEIVGLAGVKAA
ncbi:MAG: hypothetical protein COW73_10980 [Nitrospirae bacterium CG18_big_fil_WC_8_21_14_2_50_70_55]|nr:DUF523 domain-containing protein [Deltaproteobacteria bacterium]PIQ03501.1 MAG: hypothetical protein COW73_10980 [Nitrospirae bacterium CG18_big_fil_WC_8_21_14_2_50_70_55]PIU77550.1 MAG: DUF523 domain-containing protein [Nitrospirae bacterium CG06_land_8_20_14_3_00_70_43]PIW83678.1 MAG: DUF523 domain-containing protein [Nitrospirae bacterium CG_4_8_14_3_um_filter_70_85]PIX83033.1 MAG: DUF523 domain-containing protein [Nitrospirae bacterium CG_4_10_14_3_um_filter_70_108]PJB97150.1 MAG: DUF52